MYYPRKSQIVKDFNRINENIFGNVIRKPEFVIRQLREAYGQTHDNSFRGMIELNKKFVTREYYINILAHEMVHVWELQVFGRMGHGKRFYSWQKKFEEFDLELREFM